ncbi:WD40-repeat-containing domain protein [Yarrowia lipolytica]|jgi:COMPASS component SWD2|uniref:YALI0F21263p n=2 Tax=Yarrowia lipolytica TaxID=4952 RepID=Q6C0W1_YARLI|nr:YALI0F21263p [Yarrowia lipolytica CLIB122]AOW07508.1 hypothetical protein YALI1_F28112g [Yarrowia lipolytica]KAB8286564.1 WD40-repeat-containing domain protein [Yarrowia lipolytica]KAE8173491.1 WD40-repeat-containing domain protein [Yarrowia lipolytica]KAJ8055419.1 WD40-repeat-containing domain protein [Yarrowia lipolytica]QNP99339.1 WD repeat-containing protein 82 [Yarrowia lipolytica]|eukprot:XP_505701.1 YALI0F21263p [Yarrowia lipolytica CLIB122]
MESVPASIETYKTLKPSKTLRYHHNDPITSLDFDDTGAYAVTAGTDESIQLYSAHKGTHQRSSYSKKYGAHLARFTHNSMSIVYASTKEDDTIRYLSLHDNSYIRYFRGHKDKVHALNVSPISDVLLSASMDHTVRLWDLRSPHCQGVLNLVSPNLIAFDPRGLCFGVANTSAQDLSLYSVSAWGSDPFATFALPAPPGDGWASVEFSNDGKYILLATYGEQHHVIDAFTGNLTHKLVGHHPLRRDQDNMRGGSTHTAFSVDGRTVFGCSRDGKIIVWDLQDRVDERGRLYPSKALNCAPNAASPQILGVNPASMQLATADKELTFWLPEKDVAEPPKEA